MGRLSIEAMRGYLKQSISSLNRNKLNGLLAEIDLRRYLAECGYGDRISPGGWIARRQGPGDFGHNTIVFFPEKMLPDMDYPPDRKFPQPPLGLHTICATFHQTGIASYYCSGVVCEDNDPTSIKWSAVRLGLPNEQPFQPFPECVGAMFQARPRKHSFLRYNTNASAIPDEFVAEQFFKENIRIAFSDKYLAEISDVDGVFWGQQFTYPLEIKEKTVAEDRALGPYFGLDLGPFVKLAYYAAKRGNLHSLFIVREIASVDQRELVDWWFITYDNLAQYASWVPQGGGKNMRGGGSTVVRIPRAEFSRLNRKALESL